jgi:hypothetical protein
VKDKKCIIIKELSLLDTDEYTRANCELEFLASDVIKDCQDKDPVGMKRIIRIYDV